YVRRRREYLSKIALAASEVSATADLGGGVLPLAGLEPVSSGEGNSRMVEPVGIPSLSTGPCPPDSSPSWSSNGKAAADSSSVSLARFLGGGIGAGFSPGGADSTLTRNDNGPMRSRSSFLNSCSPLTARSLSMVPLVLSKSRTKTLSPRTSKAQWRLLIMGL